MTASEPGLRNEPIARTVKRWPVVWPFVVHSCCWRLDTSTILGRNNGAFDPALRFPRY
jgi:hypothetical protein